MMPRTNSQFSHAAFVSAVIIALFVFVMMSNLAPPAPNPTYNRAALSIAIMIAGLPTILLTTLLLLALPKVQRFTKIWFYASIFAPIWSVICLLLAASDFSGRLLTAVGGILMSQFIFGVILAICARRLTSGALLACARLAFVLIGLFAALWLAVSVHVGREIEGQARALFGDNYRLLVPTGRCGKYMPFSEMTTPFWFVQYTMSLKSEDSGVDSYHLILTGPDGDLRGENVYNWSFNAGGFVKRKDALC